MRSVLARRLGFDPGPFEGVSSRRIAGTRISFERTRISRVPAGRSLCVFPVSTIAGSRFDPRLVTGASSGTTPVLETPARPAWRLSATEMEGAAPPVWGALRRDHLAGSEGTPHQSDSKFH